MPVRAARLPVPAVRPPDHQCAHRGRHGQSVVLRRRGHARRPHRGCRRRTAQRKGETRHRRARAGGRSGVHRHAGSLRDRDSQAPARALEDHPGHHERDHRRGELRVAGRATGPDRRRHGGSALDLAGRLFPTSRAPGDGDQFGHVCRGRFRSTRGDGRRVPAAHGRRDAADGTARRFRDAGRRDGVQHRADLRAHHLLHHGRADRARAARGGGRRRLRLPHPERRRQRAAGDPGGDPDRQPGRDVDGNPPPQSGPDEELGADAGARGAHRFGEAGGRGRGRRPVSLRRERNGAQPDSADVDAGRRDGFDGGTARGFHDTAAAPRRGGEGRMVGACPRRRADQLRAHRFPHAL